MPATIGAIIIGLLIVMQVIGEIIEFKGKTAPEFMKWRKVIKRKREEKQALKDLPIKIQEFNDTLNKFNQHYSPANIKKRNDWMAHINDKEEIYDEEIEKLSKLLAKVNQTVVDIQIDNKRSQIIDFARIASDDSIPVTREQFNRILKMFQGE